MRKSRAAADALCFGSGMAAVCSFFETVGHGEHVVAPRIMYHGTQDWLRRMSEKRGVDVDFFDAADPQALASCRHSGKNHGGLDRDRGEPDLGFDRYRSGGKTGARSRRRDSGGGLALWRPPVTTQALSLGADIVFHSATKYLNGHSDVVGGILVTAKG